MITSWPIWWPLKTERGESTMTTKTLEERIAYLREGDWDGAPHGIVRDWALAIIDELLEERVSEKAIESQCEPNGNYGLCKTHPTCELVRKMLGTSTFPARTEGG